MACGSTMRRMHSPTCISLAGFPLIERLRIKSLDSGGQGHEQFKFHSYPRLNRLTCNIKTI